MLISFLLLLSVCGCSGNTGEELSEVNMKNDLSVQITCGQISYNGIVSYKNATLYVSLSDNENILDGMLYEINSSEVKFCYENMTKTLDYNSFPDDFIPKILYEFFSVCGEVFFTEAVVTNEYTYIERKVCGSEVRFCVNQNNTEKPYSIYIK